MNATETRQRWDQYLHDAPNYGLYHHRIPEYEIATNHLRNFGLKDDDIIVDVGAGACDMDHYLRTGAGWRGKYLPIDGATYGIDFNERLPYTFLPSAKAAYYVCLETLEHLYDPERMVRAMQQRTLTALVVSTPNPETHDVCATDSTHFTPIWPRDLEEWGFTVVKYTLNARGEGDTLFGLWTPNMVHHDEEFPVG